MHKFDFISLEIYVADMTNMVTFNIDIKINIALISPNVDTKISAKNTNGRIRKKYMHECKNIAISQIIRKYESRYSGIV